MTFRKVIDARTGEESVVNLTAEEIAAAEASAQAETAARAARARIYKAEIFRRMSDAEFGRFTAAKGQQNARKAAIFEAVEYIRVAHPEYLELKAAMEATFGGERAAELLAPTD